MLALSACGSGSTAAPTAGGGPPDPSPTPTCDPAPLAERAASVLVVGLPNVTDPEDPLAAEVVDLGVSGVFLVQENVQSARQLTALTAGLRARAARPFLVSTDEEGGRVSVLRDVLGGGPSPRRLAAERTPQQVQEFGRELGGELAGLGIDLDLAPGLDLDDGPSGGIIGDRSFSADPGEAADYALAFARGLSDSGVAPTVKHFPGHGRSATDTHKEGDVVEASLEELETTDLLPFQRAIDAGVPVVMTNHLEYSEFDAGLPASLSPRAYDLLREMGFEGVAITDSLGMGAVHSRWDFPVSSVMAITAGADLALVKDGSRATEVRDAIVAAVASGELPEERLNEAAGRATALAGGDPQALACSDAVLPVLAEAAPAVAGASTSPGASPAAGPTPAAAPGTPSTGTPRPAPDTPRSTATVAQ